MTMPFQHPTFTRRQSLQAGALGLLGLGMGELASLRAASGRNERPKACIYIFLSGGLSQIDSFDPKPDGRGSYRGEFRPIACRTVGVQICEHMPRLAARSQHWSLVRSLTHKSNDHSAGHHIMLTGRSDLPAGFDPARPRPSDWPSIASIVGAVAGQRHNLPPAIVLPERLVHTTGRTLPGQFAGVMGRRYDPFFLEASAFDPYNYGAFPTYEFDFERRNRPSRRTGFVLPSLSLPESVTPAQLLDRLALLRHIDAQRRDLETTAAAARVDRERAAAVALLTEPSVRRAFDLSQIAQRDLDRYGQHSFGWSLLIARRLVEAGVSLIQVNLGNNECWDTHNSIFRILREKLLPPTDQSLSALVDDLSDRGLLDSTLLVMAGEFGRTPYMQQVNPMLASQGATAGRDHWGAVQSVWFAGGGVVGGRVVGSSDPTGGYPNLDPQTPEAMAATIYHCLGLPQTLSWHDALNRPHHLYQGSPIAGLL